MKKILITLLILCFMPLAYAASQQPLPEAQAFQFSLTIKDPNTLLAQWDMAPQYYLYKDRFKFQLGDTKTAELGNTLFPVGEVKHDVELGEYQIYTNNITLPIAILGLQPGTAILNINYQGCAASGFCYPPMTKLVELTIDDSLAITNIAMLEAAAATEASTAPASDHPLDQQNLLLALVSFFGIGLLLAFTPCVLPMVPIIFGIIANHGTDISTGKAFRLSLTYVLSMSVTYAVFGIVVASAGHNLQAALQHPWIISLYAAVFVLLALSMFGFYDLRLPTRFEATLANISRHQKKGSYVGVVIMGVLATLILSPCVTAPLVGVLGYIASTGNITLGGLALFTLSLGMGTPLLLLGTSGGKLLPKAGMWMNTIKYFLGVLLLGVAIYLLSRIIPAQLTMALWAILCIISAIYMGAFNRKSISSWGGLSQGLGLILFLYGCLLIIGAAMGNTDLTKPLENLRIGNNISQSSTPDKLNFKKIKSVADLNAAIAAADKPVMLDFYADWCISCKVMERTTFRDAKVRELLSQYVLLKADVTANDATDKVLEKHLNVIAPPTLVFFDKDGSEQSRLVGEISAKQLIEHLQK